MPSQVEDVGFTFDPKPFLNGLNQVSGGLQKLEKGIGKAFTAAALKVAAIGLAVKGAFSVMKQYIPEIGKSFEFAKDIFFKNFFWPIRQYIAPMLQKMLDWVRDHRALFVKWGGTVVSIFKIVTTFAKGVWSILMAIVNAIKPFIQNFFKGGLADMVNLLLTKLAVLVSWITQGIATLINQAKGPLGEIFGLMSDIVGQVWKFVKHLFTANAQGKSIRDVFKNVAEAIGLAFKVVLEIVDKLLAGINASQLTDAMTPINGVAAALKGLMKSLDDLFSSKGGGNFVEWIGHNFGNEIQQSLLMVAYAVEVVVDALQWLIQAIKSVTDLAAGKALKDIGKDMAALAAQQGERWKPLLSSQMSLFKDEWKQVSGLFGGAPEAAAKPGQGGSANPTRGGYTAPKAAGPSATVGPVTINVAGAIPKDKASIDRVLDEMTGAFRNKVQASMVAGGAH